MHELAESPAYIANSHLIEIDNSKEHRSVRFSQLSGSDRQLNVPNADLKALKLRVSQNQRLDQAYGWGTIELEQICFWNCLKSASIVLRFTSKSLAMAVSSSSASRSRRFPAAFSRASFLSFCA